MRVTPWRRAVLRDPADGSTLGSRSLTGLHLGDRPQGVCPVEELRVSWLWQALYQLKSHKRKCPHESAEPPGFSGKWKG